MVPYQYIIENCRTGSGCVGWDSNSECIMQLGPSSRHMIGACPPLSAYPWQGGCSVATEIIQPARGWGLNSLQQSHSSSPSVARLQDCATSAGPGYSFFWKSYSDLVKNEVERIRSPDKLSLQVTVHLCLKQFTFKIFGVLTVNETYINYLYLPRCPLGENISEAVSRANIRCKWVSIETESLTKRGLEVNNCSTLNWPRRDMKWEQL